MKKHPKKPLHKLVLLLTLLFGINIVFLGVFLLKQVKAKKVTTPYIKTASAAELESYAKTIVTTCQTAEYKPTCYEKEVPRLMDQLSMEQTFAVTRIVQAMDTSYTYCHVLGHELSAREVAKNPDNWKEVLSRCPSGVCSNGCIHGGFQERFRKELGNPNLVEKYKSDLTTVCEARPDWNPTGIEQASCYHALGHLTMYATAADIPKSLRVCDDIAVKDDGRDFRAVCYDGVFMQIFQPLEEEDFALVKGKVPSKEQIPTYCAAYTGTAKGSCISESWPLFITEIKQPQGVTKHCTQLSDPNLQTRCYQGLFYVLTSQFNFDEARISEYCSALSGDLRGMCYANAASRMIETDYRNIKKSIALCNSSGENACYQELVSYASFNFHPNSPEVSQLCSQLPEPWKTQCGNN